MLKIVVFLISFIFLNITAEANELKFEFKKGMLPNNYYLITNNDEKRTVEFQGCYNSTPFDTNYYVQMKNGSKYYFDSKIFCEIGIKGRYWITFGDRGKILFKIQKNIMQNAEKVIFRGSIYLPIRTDSFVDSTDMRDLIVTYDVQTGRASFEIGKEVLKQPEFNKTKESFNQEPVVEYPRGMGLMPTEAERDYRW